MENRCVCCGSVIPEGRQVCRECEVNAGMNREGYKDPTAEQALWGVWKEERVRALEEKYGVHRGDKVSIQEVKRMEDQPGGKRMFTKTRKLKVVDLYKNFILLEDKLGYQESFLWQEFLQKWKR